MEYRNDVMEWDDDEIGFDGRLDAGISQWGWYKMRLTSVVLSLFFRVFFLQIGFFRFDPKKSLSLYDKSVSNQRWLVVKMGNFVTRIGCWFDSVQADWCELYNIMIDENGLYTVTFILQNLNSIFMCLFLQYSVIVGDGYQKLNIFCTVCQNLVKI